MKSELARVFSKIREYKDASVVLLGLLVFSILRIPSVIEPYWYGDEGIYQVIGMAMNRGRLLYEGIWDNKPPLLYIIYGIFDGELFYIRFLSLIIGAASIVFFYLLAKKLFRNTVSIITAVSVYSILFALPTLEGNIANAENFMLLPIIAAFYFAFKNSSERQISHMIIAGLLLSSAFLIKIVAIFDLAALASSLFILRFYEDMSISRKNITRQLKNLFITFTQETVVTLSFLVPVLALVIFFFAKGAFSDFFRASFFQNVGYVGYGNDLLFPMGFLFLKLFLLAFSILMIARFRKTLGVSGVIIFTWTAFSMFNAFFSQRPYTHYLLTLLPAFALYTGYIFDNKRLLKITLPLLLILLFVVFQTFRPNFKKVIPYYTNYMSFVTGYKNVEDYRAFFDRRTPMDYEIARFIREKTSEDENVFLWSDSGQIYALSGKLPPGRYIVSYHITFYPEAIEETKKAIDKAQPKYIIQTKEGDVIKNFLDGYSLRYIMDNVKIYEKEL